MSLLTLTKLNKDTDSIRSPFRFVGSKYQAIKFLKPIWDIVNHDEYREPLLGGGAVFFYKQKTKFNWLNDIDKKLITTYKIMQDSRKRSYMIKKVMAENPGKTRHTEIKNMGYGNTDLDIAWKYYYLNRTSYSGIMKLPPYGYSKTKSVPPSRWGERITEAGKKLHNVKLTFVDFTKVIEAPARGKNVFIFVDPPYYLADQKRAYVHSFRLDDHVRLAKTLKKTPHKFCLTYDDCDEVRNLYKWAKINAVEWRYHTANSNVTNRKMGKELIITNFTPLCV